MIYDRDIHNDTSSLQICPARIIQYIFSRYVTASVLYPYLFLFLLFFLFVFLCRDPLPLWSVVCWDLHLLEHASKADTGPCALTGSPYVWGWMMFLCALCKTEMLFVRMWQWEQMNLCLRCSQIHRCKCNRKTYK